MQMSGASVPASEIMSISPVLPRFHLQNPFVFHFGQVFTGFGAGCGVGIGVGRALNLGSVPVVGQLVSSREFGQLGYQVHNMIRKLGIKNLEAGVGCGIGIGRGFGVGLALKPGTVEQLWGCIQDGMKVIWTQVSPHLGTVPGNISSSLRNTSLPSWEQVASPVTSMHGITTTGVDKVNSATSKSAGLTQSGLETIGKKSDTELERTQLERDMLQMLLRHQKHIEDLKQEVAALQSLHTDLRNLNGIESYDVRENLHHSGKESTAENSPRCCFECRQRMRRR